jgi:hypothetical protein
MPALQAHARSSPELSATSRHQCQQLDRARCSSPCAPAIMFAELTWGPVIDHPGRRTPDAGHTFTRCRAQSPRSVLRHRPGCV